MALIQRSSNPALSEKIFSSQGFANTADQAMTIQGTVNKTLILAGIVFATAFYTWSQLDAGATGFSIWMIVGAIGGFITAMVAIFNPKSTPISAPIYAAFEGLFLGGISHYLEMRYPGIAMQAVLITMGTLFSMLFLYKARIIRVTEKLRAGLITALTAVFFTIMVSWIISFFGVHLPMFGSGPIGIGFSLFMVGLAAFMLLLDFDFIEKGSSHGLPKHMEWYGAFSLMVTLIWLYMEVLRLLSKLRD